MQELTVRLDARSDCHAAGLAGDRRHGPDFYEQALRTKEIENEKTNSSVGDQRGDGGRHRLVSRRQPLVHAARRGRKGGGGGDGQGAEAMPNPSTVHIVAKMRTMAHDNFSLIGADFDFVPVEIWKQFGEKPKWRVEKPGRVAVMDGDSTVMLIRPDYVVQFPHASQALSTRVASWR